MVNKSSVIIGTYNVENLFAGEDIARGQRVRPKSIQAQAALAETLRRTDADVVSLQEVSSRKTLDSFLERHHLSEIYPYVARMDGNSDRGINVAVLSKYPIETIVTHREERFPLADGTGETRFSRDFLRADINVDGFPGADLTVYTTHSKSRLPARPGEPNADLQRLSEGMAMRRIAEQEMKAWPSRLFVITGDLNDSAEDPSVQALLHPPSGEAWRDSLEGLPAAERNTWPADPKAGHGRSPEQFDHIIYSPSRAGRLLDSRVHRYGKSLDGLSPRLSAEASDHLMITAEFKLAGEAPDR